MNYTEGIDLTGFIPTHFKCELHLNYTRKITTCRMVLSLQNCSEMFGRLNGKFC